MVTPTRVLLAWNCPNAEENILNPFLGFQIDALFNVKFYLPKTQLGFAHKSELSNQIEFNFSRSYFRWNN